MCELLGALLWRYFEQSRRFEAAVAFFAPLQAEVLSCGAHVAAAQRELGELPEAIGTLCELLHLQPSSAPLLVCHAGLEPSASGQGPRQVLFCYSHARAVPWTTHASGLEPG